MRRLAGQVSGPAVKVVAARLASGADIDVVADRCAYEPLSLLAGNASVAHDER